MTGVNHTSAGTVEAWCQPMDKGEHTPRKFLLYFEDADRGIAVFDNEEEAREAFAKANTAWNCYLFGAMPLHPVGVAQSPTRHLQCERCGEVAIASGTLCDDCAELSIEDAQPPAAPVEKSGIMQAAAKAAEKVASWSPSKREYADRVVGAPAAPTEIGYNLATGERDNEETDPMYFHSSAGTVHLEELPDELNPPAIDQLFARDDLYTARAVFARLRNFGYAVTRAQPQASADTAEVVARLRKIVGPISGDTLPLMKEASDLIEWLSAQPQESWQPIETAPVAPNEFDSPPRLLVWVADGGLGRKGPYGVAAFGYCYRSSIDSEVRAKAEGYNGNWKITHWMPMPGSPLPRPHHSSEG
jgi:hypothetical protein